MLPCFHLVSIQLFDYSIIIPLVQGVLIIESSFAGGSAKSLKSISEDAPAGRPRAEQPSATEPQPLSNNRRIPKKSIRQCFLFAYRLVCKSCDYELFHIHLAHFCFIITEEHYCFTVCAFFPLRKLFTVWVACFNKVAKVRCHFIT